MTDIIRYEHPLSERIRNFLRIEHLFMRFRDTCGHDDACSHHHALFTLFEIMEAASQAELKLKILQELERQKTLVTQYVSWSDERREVRAKLLHQAVQGLQNVQQKLGQHLRENEWLMSIRQRMLVPGGTSPFDLPSYYFWQQKSADERRQDLRGWIQSLLPTYDAIYLLLHILRNNSTNGQHQTKNGSYQYNRMAQNVHLLIVHVDKKYHAMPEISANKYFTHIRFLDASCSQVRGESLSESVPFELLMCSFDPNES